MTTTRLSPRLSPNERAVLRQRYLAKNSRGIRIESPADMFRRVADDIALAEPITQRKKLARHFYEVMASLTARATENIKYCPVLMCNRVEPGALLERPLLNIGTKLTAQSLGDKYFFRLYDAVRCREVLDVCFRGKPIIGRQSSDLERLLCSPT